MLCAYFLSSKNIVMTEMPFENDQTIPYDSKLQHRLNILKGMFQRKEIKSFEQIFAVHPPTPLSKSIGINTKNKFEEKIANPELFTYLDIIHWANFYRH